jgi:hypothetical protein
MELALEVVDFTEVQNKLFPELQGARVWVPAWLPRMFSRAKIRSHSPGSHPDRFD